MSEKYETHVKAILSECPDADPKEIAEAFAKYETEFYIPPQDAMRSILRRFKGEQSVPTNRSPSQGGSSAPRNTKKVSKLSELNGNDKDIEIEVEIISHNMREQTIRGEQKQIAFGLLEDNPWEEKGEKTRWEYKDWGPSANLAPGSIVRIEGASVNEYQGRMSLNINQSTRIAVVREGTRPVVAPGEPQEINSLPSDGYVCVVGRILASRPDQIHKKDGSGSIDIVRGRIADESGTIGFLSWEPFEHQVGSLLKIEGAQVRTFRDTPELNFGRTTKVEVFHDKNFADTESLSQQTVLTISDLRDGARDVDAVVQITEWAKRSFTRDGEERFLWSGQIADPTGRCRMSAWSELPISEDQLPVTVRLKGVRVRAWQGIPDITVDTTDQVEILESTPWDDTLDLTNHTAEVELHDLANGSSRVGVSTSAIIVSVREDSGFILRCTECRRVLREGACAEHGPNNGNSDIRLRLVMDDGRSSVSLLTNKAATLELLGMDEDQMKVAVDEDGQMAFVQSLRSKLLGRMVKATGRTIVDEQGAMMLADGASIVEEDAGMRATELRAHWGVA
jgi:ssDNA-binding replication factor A large subunit